MHTAVERQARRGSRERQAETVVRNVSVEELPLHKATILIPKPSHLHPPRCPPGSQNILVPCHLLSLPRTSTSVGPPSTRPASCHTGPLCPLLTVHTGEVITELLCLNTLWLLNPVLPPQFSPLSARSSPSHLKKVHQIHPVLCPLQQPPSPLSLPERTASIHCLSIPCSPLPRAFSLAPCILFLKISIPKVNNHLLVTQPRGHPSPAPIFLHSLSSMWPADLSLLPKIFSLVPHWPSIPTLCLLSLLLSPVIS